MIALKKNINANIIQGFIFRLSGKVLLLIRFITYLTWVPYVAYKLTYYVMLSVHYLKRYLLRSFGEGVVVQVEVPNGS